MKAKLSILLLALASLSTGCIVHSHPRPGPVYAPAPPPPPPPPPPPVAQPMSYPEAVQLGSNYAASRGYQSNVQEAHLEKNNSVWKVKLAVYRGDVRGHLHLQYDAFSRALLRADEKVKDHKGHGHGNGKWDDDDDDDDGDRNDHVHGASAVGNGHQPPPVINNNNGQVHGATPVPH